MEKGVEGRGWDAEALLQEEVQNLSRRVEALIKWTEEFEEQIIFVGKTEGGKEKGSPEEKSPGMQSQSPWPGESPESNSGAEVEVAFEASDVDMFGANSSFADWKPEESEPEPVKAEAPAAFSLLSWD